MRRATRLRLTDQTLDARGAGCILGGVARFLRGILRILGVVALTYRDHPDQECDHSQDRGGADEDSQSPRAPPRLGRFAVAERKPRIDELRLSVGEALSACEFDRGIEPQPTVEIGVAASVFVPSLGRAAQFLVHEKFGPLLGDPGAESRPHAQQRLMDERDLVAVDDEQPGVGECRDDIGSPLRVHLDEFVAGSPATRVFAIRSQFDHAQDDAARHLVAFVVERRQRALGRGRDRRMHAARLAVPGNGDPASLAP